MWFDNGFYVTIETKSGFFTYKYVFPRFRHRIAEKNLPFEIIREQIAEKPKLPEQQSVRLAMSAKKTAVTVIDRSDTEVSVEEDLNWQQIIDKADRTVEDGKPVMEYTE